MSIVQKLARLFRKKPSVTQIEEASEVPKKDRYQAVILYPTFGYSKLDGRDKLFHVDTIKRSEAYESYTRACNELVRMRWQHGDRYKESSGYVYNVVRAK
jgi:hypothetical protein